MREFVIPWPLLTLIQGDDHVCRWAEWRIPEIHDWLDEHAGARGWRFENGEWAAKARQSPDREFKLIIDDERVAIHFILRWSEEMKPIQYGERFTIYRMRDRGAP